MMLLAHADPAAGGAWPYAVGLGVGYLALALRRRHDPRGWSAWRTAAFVAGSLVLAVGVTPQLLYAGLLTDVGVTTDELRGGATLMYYGGDFAELLLAFALVSTWRPAVVGGRGVATGRGRSRAPTSTSSRWTGRRHSGSPT